jgi:hypothetical protein
MSKLFIIAVSVSLLAIGCNSDKRTGDEERAAKALGKATAGANATPASFEIVANRLIVTEALAPNETYAQNGLGLKAKSGNTFACVQYSIKNTGAKPADGVQPKLTAASGAEYDVSVDAAGKMPSNWTSFKLDPIGPGSAQEGNNCFEIPAEAAKGALKLHFKDTGWGARGPWEKSINVPAASTAQSSSGGGSGSASTTTLSLAKLSLKAEAPTGATVGKALVGDGLMIQGPNLVVTVEAASRTRPKTLKDAQKEAKSYSPTNVKTETLPDGWALTFQNKGSMGANFFVNVRREIGGKAFWCETTGSQPEQQTNALNVCKSLKKG